MKKSILAAFITVATAIFLFFAVGIFQVQGVYAQTQYPTNLSNGSAASGTLFPDTGGSLANNAFLGQTAASDAIGISPAEQVFIGLVVLFILIALLYTFIRSTDYYETERF